MSIATIAPAAAAAVTAAAPSNERMEELLLNATAQLGPLIDEFEAAAAALPVGDANGDAFDALAALLRQARRAVKATKVA